MDHHSFPSAFSLFNNSIGAAGIALLYYENNNITNKNNESYDNKALPSQEI